MMLTKTMQYFYDKFNLNTSENYRTASKTIYHWNYKHKIAKTFIEIWCIYGLAINDLKLIEIFGRASGV